VLLIYFSIKELSVVLFMLWLCIWMDHLSSGVCWT
jgi:hypothetical protein